MPLIIARSLVVYGGTAALCLFLAHRLVLPVRAPVALLIAAAPLLLTGKALLTGDVWAPLDIVYHHEPFRSHRSEAGMTTVQTPILSDVVHSMIPWQKAVREAVKAGRAPLWNRFVLAGEPLLAVQQAAALHPFTWLGFLLPLGQAWTFQMSARLLLSILSAYLLVRDMGCRQPAALLAGFGWGFSDFMVFWIGYPVGNALAAFPLLILGLSRLVRDADRRAVALTVVALCLIVAAGHPETLLFAVTGAGLYFLFLLGFAGRGKRARPVLLSLVAGALALGLTAVQLVPFAEILPHTWENAMRSQWYAHAKKSFPLAESVRTLEMLPFAYGEAGNGPTRGAFAVPGGYAGALLLPFAVSGLFSRDRRRWAFLTLALLGLALWARLALVTDALAALPLFDVSVLDYFVFLAVFGTCGLAALGADRLLADQGRAAFLFGAALALAAIVGLSLALAPRQLDMSQEFLRRRTLLQVVPLLLGLFLMGFRTGGLRARTAVGTLLAVFVAARLIEAGGIYRTCPARAFAPRLPILDPIPRGTPVRIVGLGETFIPNSSALYELEDVRGYESLTLRPFVETFPSWCVSQGAWFNRVDDLSRPFLSFLNVRYAIVPAGLLPPDGWQLQARNGGADLLENTRALDRVFVPVWVRREADVARRLELVSSISDFGQKGVLGASPGESSAEWSRNGRARVAIASYRGDALTLDIDADAETVIATSITAWPGWKVTLDGTHLAPLSYNHAFLGFQVPGGRHRAELRYRPDGVLLGASLTLLTLAVAAVARRASARRPRIGTRVLSSPAPQ